MSGGRTSIRNLRTRHCPPPLPWPIGEKIFVPDCSHELCLLETMSSVTLRQRGRVLWLSGRCCSQTQRRGGGVAISARGSPIFRRFNPMAALKAIKSIDSKTQLTSHLLQATLRNETNPFVSTSNFPPANACRKQACWRVDGV
jgi:hypothetical protein